MAIDRTRIWESIIVGLVVAAAMRFLFPALAKIAALPPEED